MTQDQAQVAREVRFAVVMYGGVSLAIYLNGVTQELLRLVRATATVTDADGERTRFSDAELSGTERLYRRIAQRLDHQGGWDPPERWDAVAGPIRIRFVIDILSGTSAGGINAVFLAKALATGQSMDALARLWVEEGAIESLINDRHSKFDDRPVPDEARSLLNSRRMYRRLVDALEGMEQSATGEPTPLVPSVDLFVTTTDIRGLPIALRLADKVVGELRHRNVFHFRYAADRPGADANEFTERFNPFLAFAARCTSSFPVAFEPMTLADVDDVLARRPGGAPLDAERLRLYERFFPAYFGRPDGLAGFIDAGSAGSGALQATPLGARRLPADRPFGDGGYLDNKPFEHAIAALAARRATLPVDRKLLYLEPDPGQIPQQLPGDPAPNAIENALVALNVARYETIRSDLQRVLVRNRLVDRVERIVGGIDEDLQLKARPSNRFVLPAPDAGMAFQDTDLSAMVWQFGLSYGGYHRLKVSALTDEIAQYVSRAAGFADDSDEFQAVRLIVGAWRNQWFGPRYADEGPYPPNDARFDRVKADRGELRLTENAYLLFYDLGYRIRRLSFVLGRIDRLLCFDERATELASRRGVTLTPELRDAFVARLRATRAALAPFLAQLQRTREELLEPDPSRHPLRAQVAALGITQG
ncbi:MAG TPA: patatin-like protein, partial [Gemmatimonadaceae bacterium]|nr:patatin-like protein [Gemmatimonadaceae bacterium]